MNNQQTDKWADEQVDRQTNGQRDKYPDDR